jgi:protein phosphatase
MGSRAVAVVCRDASVARARFGIETGEQGIVYTRTGRRFFNNLEVEWQLIKRVASALDRSGFWESHETDWVCLDCELMPWSAKARELLQSQYASVGAAARHAVPAVVSMLERAAERLVDSTEVGKLGELMERFSNTASNAHKFTAAYQQYCWPVDSINDLKLAPFHILATEGAIHSDRDHLWHMNEIAKFSAAEESELIFTTRHIKVDLQDESSVQAAEQWWLDMTSAGGEGMVVKPMDFITEKRASGGRSDIVQPAVKVRGAEYLRIIYGLDYDKPKNLDRLRQRHLGRKRSLAIREFALGIEALERFIKEEPLRKVHECVFGVLALESEPVDPRL